MHQAECAACLRWAMPRLGLDWPGFQHCHRQVCNRLHRRIVELGRPSFAAYRSYVLYHATEWQMIDEYCRVTVSRFYRDRDVFDRLASEILPQLAAKVDARGDTVLRVWSAGCGGGEEPFSLALAWRFGAASRYPRLNLEIVATDIDDGQLARADAGCYRPSSLREVPAAWLKTAFVAAGPLRCLKPEYRAGITFRRQDIRGDAPAGTFDLILCRNLAFTYFDDAQQREIVAVVRRKLKRGGVFVIGRSERLPAGVSGLVAPAPHLRIFTHASPAGGRVAG